MLYPVIALIVNLFGFTVLAYALSRKAQFDRWLILLLIVLALQISDNLGEVMGSGQVVAAADKQFMRTVELISSAMSTYLLAMAALALMGKRGYLIQLGVLVGYVGQVYGVVTQASDAAFKVYAAMDVSGCALAGGLFGVALSRQFGKSSVAVAALFFPLMWGYADLFFWSRDHFGPFGQIVCDTGMSAGALGTAAMAAYFVCRAPPTGSMPSNGPVPRNFTAVASANA